MANEIIISNLTFGYRQNLERAISNLSGELPCGMIVGIVGESGIGKSTLLRIISGVYRKSDDWIAYYEGEVRIAGQNPDEIRGPAQVSLTTQNPFLLNHLTVEENILLPISLAPELKTQMIPIDDLIELLGLYDKREAKPAELSGGMKTRVAFARAIISQPQYLFLDEPFISLDIQRRWAIYKVVLANRSDDRITTVMTTHDLWEALILANMVMVLSKDSQGNSIAHYIKNIPQDITNESITECLQRIQPKMEYVVEYLSDI